MNGKYNVIATAMFVLLMVAGLVSVPGTASAQAEPYIGQIMWTATRYCPQGWAVADGQLLQISENAALYSLLGTFYGGDGIHTFALPDLRGRVAVGNGLGPGLSNRSWGEYGGAEQATLQTENLPAHSHALNAKSGPPATSTPTGNYPASFNAYKGSGSTAALNSGVVGTTGSGTPVGIMQPYAVLTPCIALQGVYPVQP